MSLYFRMAIQNLRKNYRFFIPRILTEGGLLAAFYIVYTLMLDERMREVKGGSYLPIFMGIGAVVIGILSFVLMLYTNSFLMKQRKREFGLYNVLGMEKRHVGKVLLWESLVSSAAGIVLGLLGGILFYKLCSLLVCRLLGVPSVLGIYYVSLKTILPSAGGFLGIDLFTIILNRLSIARMKPVELMASAHTGAKPPRVRWLLLVIGVLTLGAGYWMAVSIQSPLKAILLFFVAVILVMIGTYCLFVAGTTFVLQRLQRRKSYYYNKRHMTAVSGLLYRMKQNAVGLASICILATGVLVMISTTVSLYAGTEDTLAANYPYDLYLSARYNTTEETEKRISFDDLTEIVRQAARRSGVEVKSAVPERYLEVVYGDRDGAWTSDRFDSSLSRAAFFHIMSAETYRLMTGEKLALSGNEVAFIVLSGEASDEYDGETLTIDGISYPIRVRLDAFPLGSALSAKSSYGMVVSDETVMERLLQAQRASYGGNSTDYTDQLCISFTDRAAVRRLGERIDREISNGLWDFVEAQPDNLDGSFRMYWDSVWESAEAIYGMYGSFLFLGILLGLVCLFATALIIYYKQISEGYEDRNRYQIMEKIGMSQAEVKSTIRSQVLLVFFLPLIVAGVHICFAFPILTRLLRLLLLSDVSLFVWCTILTFLVFALVYTAIYSVTARTYYKIVH